MGFPHEWPEDPGNDGFGNVYGNAAHGRLERAVFDQIFRIGHSIKFAIIRNNDLQYPGWIKILTKGADYYEGNDKRSAP